MNIDILFKILMYLIYFFNIDIHVLNIHILMSQNEKYGTLSSNDILPDTLNIDILSSYWKREKYKIL